MSLSKIQLELKAPKSQYNSFGKYKYRNCEDILEAAKPILAKHGYSLIISDDIVNISDRFYVKATAKVIDAEQNIVGEATAFAREALDKKGMDSAQVTGAASSYARKYALNGLLAIDDTKDADTTNQPDNGGKVAKIGQKEVAWIKDALITSGSSEDSFLSWLQKNRCQSIEDINVNFYPDVKRVLDKAIKKAEGSKNNA